jgi:hypothetical protein
MSAMITSEKKIGRPRGGKTHRLKALNSTALNLEKNDIGQEEILTGGMNLVHVDMHLQAHRVVRTRQSSPEQG